MILSIWKLFDPNKVKIDENSNKTILIYYIGYVTIKYLKPLKINSVKPLYLIINILNAYFEEIDKNASFFKWKQEKKNNNKIK